MFNSRAPLGWHAESAGVSPAKAVNPVVRGLLSEVGITLTERAPRVVTPDMVRRASRAVTFGCLERCPMGAEGKGEEWPIPTSTGKTADQSREIRDEIAKRIDDLIARHCTTRPVIG